MFVYVEHSRRCLFCRPRALLLLILDIKALAACKVIKTKLPMKWFISVFISIEVFKLTFLFILYAGISVVIRNQLK